jgi:hypothetical protein
MVGGAVGSNDFRNALISLGDFSDLGLDFADPTFVRADERDPRHGGHTGNDQRPGTLDNAE